MTPNAGLLEGATGMIEAWLADADATLPLRTLQGAIEIGGRALLSSGLADQDAAERYRRSLLRLQSELPIIEERWRTQQRKLQRDRESLDRAMRWSSEFRETV